jgi:hypothetical protein
VLRTKKRIPADSGGQDHLLSAVLGLLALLLGFTFSMALNRYEVRQELVAQEANAIRTTWQLAQLVEEPNRAILSGDLRDYLNLRIAWSNSNDPSVLAVQNRAIQQKLWMATGNVLRTDPGTALSQSLIEGLKDSFDLASTRVSARASRIPDRVFQVLILYAVLSMVMLGYVLASKNRRHRVATAILVLLVTISLTIILDLDRPRNGAIQVSQLPLEELTKLLR